MLGSHRVVGGARERAAPSVSTKGFRRRASIEACTCLHRQPTVGSEFSSRLTVRLGVSCMPQLSGTPATARGWQRERARAEAPAEGREEGAGRVAEMVVRAVSPALWSS